MSVNFKKNQMARTTDSTITSCDNDAIMWVDNINHYVPDCIWIDILSRLPLRSVFLFKSVSKRWFSLITDPAFIRCYISRFEDKGTPPWALISSFDPFKISVPQEYRRKHYVVSDHPVFESIGSLCPTIDFPGDGELRCVASSGQFLLFLVEGQFMEFRRSGLFHYYICNPLINQWIELPPVCCPGCEGAGFVTGVDNGTTHYKVVQIVDQSINNFYVEIFSSQTGAWKCRDVRLSKRIFPFSLSKSVSYNGAILWIDSRHSTIIAYDPNNRPDECHFLSTLSLHSYRTTCKIMLDQCQGRLRYFELDRIARRQFMRLRVWVLEDYDMGEWCLQQDRYVRKSDFVDCPDIRSSFSGGIAPMACHPTNMDLMYLWSHGHIMQYNFETQVVEEKSFPIPNMGYMFWGRVFPVVLSSVTTPAAEPLWNLIAEGSRVAETEESTVVVGKEQKGWIRKVLHRSLSCFRR